MRIKYIFQDRGKEVRSISLFWSFADSFNIQLSRTQLDTQIFCISSESVALCCLSWTKEEIEDTIIKEADYEELDDIDTKTLNEAIIEKQS